MFTNTYHLHTVRLVPNSRSYPFHFHIIRSLTHLSQHTHTYIPLAPHLLPILTSTLISSKPKSSTLRPLDFETNIRAPQQYIHTRVYNEGVADEGAFLLAEWLATPPVQGSIAFPELVVPVTVVLRKALKTSRINQKSSNGKEASLLKSMLERIEDSAKWVEQRRETVSFAPAKMGEVDMWEAGIKVEETPLGKYIKVQRKVREKRRKLVEKVRGIDFEPLLSHSRIPSEPVVVFDPRSELTYIVSFFIRQGKVKMRYWRISTKDDITQDRMAIDITELVLQHQLHCMCNFGLSDGPRMSDQRPSSIFSTTFCFMGNYILRETISIQDNGINHANCDSSFSHSTK